MNKIKVAIALFGICSMSAFADNTPLTQTAIVQTQAESKQSAPSLQNTLITFNPITTSDTKSAVIRPNDYNKTRKMSVGGYFEGFWKSGDKHDSDKDNYNDRLFAGASLNFIANDKFSTTLALGAMFDGGHLMAEVGIDYNFKPYIIRENNGVSSEPIGIFSTEGPTLSNTESIHGAKHTMQFSLGGSVLMGLPLKQDNDWQITPRANISLSYCPESAKKFSGFMKLSPGATLGSKDGSVKTVFNMGISVGVKYKVI